MMHVVLIKWNNIPLYRYTMFYSVISRGHLGYFQVLTIMNNAVRDIHVCFLWTSCFHFG